MGLLDNLFGKKELSNPETPQETETSQEQINMACAALLLEVAEADYADDPEETRAILAALEKELNLKRNEVQPLLERPGQKLPGPPTFSPTPIF